MASAESTPPEERLLHSRRFVRFAAAKALQLLAQNALMYGLFILVVSEHESALATSALILTAVVPSIFFSLPGGVAADSLPIKVSLLTIMAGRVAIAWLFLTNDPEITGMIVLSLLWWTTSQLFGPAEAAALPSLASEPRLATANSALDALSLGAQLLGAGVVAPLVLKAFDSDGLFLVVLVLLVASAMLYAVIPHLTPASRRRTRRVSWFRSLPEGLRIIRSEPSLVRVTVLKVLLDNGLKVILVAAPPFITDVLGSAPENAVYIFAPGAIGLAAGFIVAPRLLRFASVRVVAVVGFALLVGVILTMPFINEVARVLDDRTFIPLAGMQDLLGVKPAMAAMVLLLPFGGLGVSLVRVAARTAVYQYAPVEAVAQVSATQSALDSLVSPIPIIGAGLLVDWLEVKAVLIMVGLAMAVLSVANIPGRAPSSREQLGRP